MNKLFTATSVLFFSFGTFCSGTFSCGAFAADDWPPGSAMHTGQLSLKEKDRYQAKSDEILKEIYDLLNDSYLQKQVETQVTALRKYASASCSIIGEASDTGGSWPSTYATQCTAGIAYHHYRSLKNALTCIKRLEKQPYVDNNQKMSCLIQTLNTTFYE